MQVVEPEILVQDSLHLHSEHEEINIGSSDLSPILFNEAISQQ